ncbi:uncharacterized protein ACRADG_000658 [Cochliomyia hominivorax]
MRAFIVLCLVAVACADKLGYNYQPVAHSDSGLSFTPGAGVGGADYGSASNAVPNYSGDFPTATNAAPSYAAPAELDKEFFTYTVNDDDFHDPAASNQLGNSVKQGLRVIFIKGPENKGLEDAALALAKQAAEQKTAIYVLHKQADIGDLANKLNNINKNNNNKPEVHFVKYRTPEDATNAQKAIQGQYDALGGRSQSHDGGVAPVLNFASKAPAASSSAPSSSYIPPASGSASAPSGSYLPILFALIGLTIADQGYNYNQQIENSALDDLQQQFYVKPVKRTEYLTYAVPEDINDVKDASRLASLLLSQRVIFIQNPENKLFSLTAEQLANRQSLNIYVLQRQLDAAGLQRELYDKNDRIGKPNVQFIKYRTPEDIERAKLTVYNDFESIPETSKYHQNHQTPLYKHDTRPQQLQPVQQEQKTQIPILCLVTLAYANDLGYNYQPAEASNNGLSLAPGLSQDGSDLLGQEAPALLPETEFKKDFYSYAAPEGAFDDQDAGEKIASALKKNLRVLFIKSPDNKGFEEAALNLAKQAAQERTAIYVLSKQSDVGDLANKLQNLKSQSQNKPEVHFVKYRTPEDAANAQKTIQEQYNSLPGASQSINGGEASVLNFASRPPVAAGRIPPGPGHQYLPANPIPTADYLPPSLRRYRYRL